MKNLLNKIWNKEEGFTLIELIIVIAILAIIAAIAIPNVLSAVDNSRKTTDVSNAKLIADAAATVRAQKDAYAGQTYGTPTSITTSSDNFMLELVKNLNSTPVLKYKGDGANTDFKIEIASDGAIKVYADTNGGDVELYPTTNSIYTN